MVQKDTQPIPVAKQFYISIAILFSASVIGVVAENLYRISTQTDDFSILFKLSSFVVIGVYCAYVAKLLFKVGDKLPFAATSATAIALATALGTFVPQNMHIGVLEPATTALAKVLVFFQLNDVFHSWWYVSLYLNLVVSLGLVTMRYPFSKKHIGFHLTHISLIVIVLSVWVDFFFGYRGLIHLEIGKPTNVFEQHYLNSGRPIGYSKLPFTVHLQEFESEKHDADYNIQLWKKNISEEFLAGRDTNIKANPEPIASYEISEGASFDIYGTTLAFTVDKFYEDVNFKKISPNENEALPNNPVLYGSIGAEGLVRNFRLAEKDQSNIMDAPFGTEQLAFFWDKKSAQEYWSTFEKGKPTHALHFDSQTGRQSFELTPSGSFTYADSIKCKVELMYKNLQFDASKGGMYEADSEGSNPAVKIHCSTPDSTFSFVLLPEVRDHISKKAKYLEQTLNISLQYSITGYENYVVIGQEKALYSLTENEIKKDTIRPDSTYFLNGWKSIGFWFNHIFKDDSQVETVAYSQSDSIVNPLASITARNATDTLTNGYLPKFDGSYNTVFDLPNTEFFLTLESLESKETKFWKSELLITDSVGTELKKGDVSVNHPLTFSGYRFYQTDFDPERPTYSGIGITKEPALYVLYSAFYTLILGIIFMFYYKPKDSSSTDETDNSER